MKGRALLAAAAAVFALLWLLIPKTEDETARRIEGRARRDLVEACNQAAASAGETARFSVGDVAAPRLETLNPQGGVVAMASVLEARRSGLLCRWSGIDPATITRAD